MKIAATADLHIRKTDEAAVKKMIKDIPKEADVLIVAGDLTDNGLVEEAELAAKMLKSLNMPVIAVLGNHDHENGKAQEIAELLHSEDVYLLDGNTFVIDGVGFVGTKGFCGGFGNRLIQPYGEIALKNFINTSIEEVIRLENSLVKLENSSKVVVLHYAPISETLEGEPPELYPLLGTSRFGNAIDRHGADFIVHGHAHYGSPSGATPGNIPVYNVSRFVLNSYENKNYCILEA